MKHSILVVKYYIISHLTLQISKYNSYMFGFSLFFSTGMFTLLIFYISAYIIPNLLPAITPKSIKSSIASEQTAILVTWA